MMHMTFYWGRNLTLLFDSWKTNSWISYAITLFACFLFSVFYQYMEDRRIRFKLLASSPPRSDANVPLLYQNVAGGGGNLSKFTGALVFGVNSAIGYLLMLAIMSFNGGVFIAILLGLSVGYLAFRSGDGEQVVVVDNPCACA